MLHSKKKFAKVYDKYVDKIYRYIFLKVDSQETAEDLTSQVFTKAWDRIKDPDSDIKNITAYIYQIARAEVANHYRAKPSFKIISTESAQIVHTEDIEGEEQTKSDINIIMANISELKADFQNVIIWHYLDGLSFKKISEIMEKPEGTIRVMVHRALKELRDKMEENM